MQAEKQEEGGKEDEQSKNVKHVFRAPSPRLSLLGMEQCAEDCGFCLELDMLEMWQWNWGGNDRVLVF